MDKRSVAPGQNAVAVTPSDTTVVGCRALYIGGAGNVVVDFQDGNSNITFSAVPVGTLLPIAALKVKAATTATLIVALY